MDPIELTARREALGMSKTLLAEMLGNRQSSISQWETGKYKIPENVDAEIAHLEDLTEGLIEQMVAIARDLTDSGQAVAFQVHAGKWAAGPTHEGTALLAVLQRIAAARAQIILRADGIEAPIYPAQVDEK